MFRNIIERIGGSGLYGLVSMVLFFLVFVVMLIWVLRLKKPYIDHMSSKPLESDTPDQLSGEERHV